MEDGRVSVSAAEAVPLWTANNWWDEERRRVDQPDIRVIPLSSAGDEALTDERRRAIGRVLGDAVHLLP